MKGDALDRPRATASSMRVPLVVAAYGLVFFGTLPALLWAIGGRLDELLGAPRLAGPFPAAAGASVAALGAAWMAWSMIALGRFGAGWPISHLPPRRLTARGPYAVVRHPIYLGYTLAFSGAGLTTGSIGRGIAAATLLTVGWLVYALAFEEPRLVRRFGERYLAYRGGAPLFPRVLGGSAAGLAARGWRALRPRVERLANRTVLARTGPVVWVTYGALVAAGAAAMALGIGQLLVAGGVAPRRIGLYLVGLALSMLLCGRIAWLLYHPEILLREPRAALRSVGFVSWGGYVGMFGFALAFAVATGLDPLWLIDRTLLPAFVCSGLGRLGCLTYGCCYGRPSAHGIRWTHPAAKAVRELGAAGSVPRVPTPLLSALLAFSLVPILWAVSRAAPPAGAVTAIGLLLYAIGRFSVESLREQPRYGSWGLSSGQIGSAIMGAAAIVLLLTVDGPPGWTPAAWDGAAFLALAPAGALAATLVFVVCGAHWRRVGSW